jgi:DNA polymerase I-like protein with 3'-5' exonuclease and polymerase domains
MRLIFDLEANGLLNEVSLIHCIVAKDVDTQEVHTFRPDEVVKGLDLLMKADMLIGHNVIGYDIPAIQKLHPWFEVPRNRVVDTLVLSRLIWTNLSDRDSGPSSRVEAKLRGSHSLKAWGQRLGLHKGDYDGGWETFSEEMLEYNVRDVDVTERLWKQIELKAYSPAAVELEHAVAWLVSRQEKHGFVFDEAGAYKLVATLQKRQAELEAELQDTFPPFVQPTDYVMPTKSITYKDPKRASITKDAPYNKIEIVVFNPGSRRHIADRLTKLFGWKPKEFTPDGQPKIDDEVLGKLSYPPAAILTEYLMIQKRLGQISDGKHGWLKHVRQGRIHGELITNGAVTGRATHRSPNTGQVPSCNAPYGKECRSLWGVKPRKKLVGVDVSGLELRMLAHYMAKYDNGQYGKEVITGDIHTVNQKAAGLSDRGQAKTFIYAFLYGAGAAKIGQIIGAGPKEGQRLKTQFLKNVPALKKLIEAVTKAASRGYLVGLDGRHLHIRSEHAALNVLLQGAGALVCKRWLVEVDIEIEKRGWRDRVQQVAWVHDEIQVEVDEDIAVEFGIMAVECIAKTQEFFNIKLPLTGEYKVGNSWADTH